MRKIKRRHNAFLSLLRKHPEYRVELPLPGKFQYRLFDGDIQIRFIRPQVIEELTALGLLSKDFKPAPPGKPGRKKKETEENP